MAAAVGSPRASSLQVLAHHAREHFLLVLAIAALGYPSAARADCAMPDNPPGTPAPDAQAGDIAYNIDAAVMQYCNGANWIAMGGSGGSMPECDDGEMLQYDDGDDEWACVAASALGDNLGNHIATANIQLGSHWLSGDSGNEGITVDASGNVGVGIAPTHKLHVNGNLGAAASSYLNFGGTTGDPGYGIRDNGGTIECKNSGGSWVTCVDTTADCTDNSSALCKLQVARATGDPEFLAANIRDATNVLGVTGTLIEKFVDCTNDATVACTLDATRSTSDGQFLAANIKDGVNILGVTGTYTGSGSYSIVNGAHTATDCTNAGGAITPYSGIFFCSFASTSCPGGWTAYGGLTLTRKNMCSVDVPNDWTPVNYSTTPGATTQLRCGCVTGQHLYAWAAGQEACNWQTLGRSGCSGSYGGSCNAITLQVACY